MRVEFYTSAPEAYDGFSTETVKVVGGDTRHGTPVRLVSVEPRDHEWQRGRYDSGCHYSTGQGGGLFDHFVKWGDWVLSPPPPADA